MELSFSQPVKQGRGRKRRRDYSYETEAIEKLHKQYLDALRRKDEKLAADLEHEIKFAKIREKGGYKRTASDIIRDYAYPSGSPMH